MECWHCLRPIDPHNPGTLTMKMMMRDAGQVLAMWCGDACFGEWVAVKETARLR